MLQFYYQLNFDAFRLKMIGVEALTWLPATAEIRAPVTRLEELQGAR